MNKRIMLLLSVVAFAAATEKLIFFDDFTNFNFNVWEHERTLSGGGNWEFEWYVNNRSNSYVKDGVLYMKPTFTQEYLGEQNFRSGIVNIWGG